MKKEILKVKILDKQTQQLLFECPIEKMDNAYAQASLFEEMGLDIQIIVPTLSESLSQSLGHGPQDTAAYMDSLAEELEHHEGSCCFEETDKDKMN
jgi:hypothetical protein